ncbi:thioredoxin family protein [Sporosarcina limicola]|uniref:Thioredoxin-like negative regulator of GroEL n=1 Tax=Sporosarcina limicola TaxID=34101 RepID=A0A927MLS5_9BACL|nr:thioredoxin family protein [Sporosarcina limicola]MBE1553869.1 thioredoxin-like negative regulator of GroEL [Sporosarcina limicola]
MKSIGTFTEWNAIVEQEERFLLFVKTENCSVCDGLLPQVDVLDTDYPFPFYKVNVTEIPEIAGQLSLFSAPVVLLFNEGKEYARFARFVQMAELKRRLDELTEWGIEHV